MELQEAIKTRRSVREFTGERIPDEHIEMILDAARYAPSPENLQMWRYIVIREDQEMKNLIAEISVEATREIFGAQPYEATAGRLWYLPDHARPKEFEDMRDGSLFLYPKYSDTVVIGFGSEVFHDSKLPYTMELFGSVVVAMGLLQMWLVAHSMGYGCGWMAAAISDGRHRELLCDRLGVPRTWEPIGVLCIGVPKEKRMLGPSRFPMEGVMYSERWGHPYRRLAFRKEREKK
jgi:nitroreductase